MRFQTIIASAIALLAVVSAQTDIPSQDCVTCINNSVLRISICKGITVDPKSVKVDEKAKTCICSMAADLSWLTGCSSKCPKTFIDDYTSGYEVIKTNYCSGVQTSSLNSARSLTASKAGAAMVVVAAAALL